jgi:hypothetical protein
MLGAPVALAHGEVVLERRVRLLECVLELIALEDIVACLCGLAVPQLRIDNPADRPHRARLALDPHHDAFLSTGVVDPVELALREPTSVGRDWHGPTIQSSPVLRLAGLFRNPFSFLFARSSAEEQVVSYVTREHRRGRHLAEILEDRYVQNRLTPQQQGRLLERPDVVHALGEQDIDAARQQLAKR